MSRPWGPGDRVWRYYSVQVLLTLCLLVIFLRLVQIQIVDRKKYRKQALDQYMREMVVKGERGQIYDKNLIPVALNKPSFDLGIDIKFVTDVRQTSRKLASVLNQSEQTIARKLRQGRSFVFLARKLNEADASLIKLMNIPGVRLMRTTERVYPLNEKLAHVLGFVDIDGRGLSGIELAYENYLSGKDGKSIFQKDAMGNTLMPVAWTDPAQENGHDVILTIDHVYQTIAEEELKTAVEQHRAKGGTVIITEPNSGRVLAMAGLPGFDANRATEYPPETWRIRAITDIFEPGSTYKVVTLAAALAMGIDSTKSQIYCENGRYRIFGEEINDSKKYKTLSFEDVFVKSSNIGAAKIAAAVGRNQLFKTSRSFGFGNRTGIDLPGEVAGILKRPAEWSDFTLSAMSYGHEVAVTALQIAMAYGAIANGGVLMKPLIVEEVRNREKQTLLRFEPQPIRRVMSATIARRLTDILRKAVEEGTGVSAKLPGADIAGKTGTAQKPLPHQPGYSDTHYVASFAGFYPANNPSILIFVAVDEPTRLHSGGEVAAPVFRQILERILKVRNELRPEERHMRFEEKPLTKKPIIPNLANRRLEVAMSVLQEYGIKPKILGRGNVVQKQQLIADDDREPRIVLTVTDYPEHTEHVIVPDLSNHSLRRAISELAVRGLTAKISGSGRVVKQQPEPGSKIRVGARCYLICEPVIPKVLPKI